MQSDLIIRNEVLRLILRFEKRHLGLYNTTPELLQNYFGGSRRHWGQIISNNAQPTKIDLACLKLSIEFDGKVLQKASYAIRFNATFPEKSKQLIRDWSPEMDLFSSRPNPRTMASCIKMPLIRRDRSVYDRDSWQSWEDFGPEDENPHATSP